VSVTAVTVTTKTHYRDIDKNVAMYSVFQGGMYFGIMFLRLI